jgi:fructose/tagatose bisphosphate aldolase
LAARRTEPNKIGADAGRLHSTRGDALAVAEALGTDERGRYLLAATFGDVHGVYSSVNVKLRPEILRELRNAVVGRFGARAAFDFVFHGASTSTIAQITEAIAKGVVKMNIDTGMEYAYTVVSPTTCFATTAVCSRRTAALATRRGTTGGS